MPRKLSRLKFAHELEARSAFPSAPTVAKSGAVQWRLGEFNYLISLESCGHGRATWLMWVGDQYLETVRERGSGAGRVQIRPLGDVTFSITDADSDMDAFAEELRRAASFVVDREDLCRILMSENSVTRGGLEAWQLPSNYPSRLAGALILSRVLERDDLEREVLDRILDAPDTNMFGESVPAVKSVRRWLDEYTRDLDIRIDI